VLRTVTLPALRPAIVGSASIVFLFCATAFGIVLTLGGVRYSTVETEIYLLTTTVFDLQAAAALSVLQIVVVVGLLALSARLRATPDPTAQRAVTPVRAVRRSDAPVVVATLLVLAAMLVPILTLVLGSLQRRRRLGPGQLPCADHGRRRPGPPRAGHCRARDEPAHAVDAMWMALLVGGVVSLIVTRRSHSVGERRVRSTLDGFFMLPLGVSAVTLGFGFLITLDEPPLDLRDSPLLVPMAQALVALPLVVRTLAPVLGGIDDRQRQAAASLGASPWRTLLTVDLPAVWKPMLAASRLRLRGVAGGVRRDVLPGPRHRPDPADRDLPSHRAPR
jgi:thiamine transport system permease protein